MKTTNTSAAIGYVKLELLRPGPAHNQLLSPLTPYIALCGADGPVTIRIPFEHRHLLMRLARLRYPQGKDPATDDQRQAEIRDIGETIGSILSQVPALLTELGNANVENKKLIHLRLALSGLELGMIPFEAAVAPDGFPGSGSPLFLQMRTPISITREVRHGKQPPVDWTRPPRILFAFAAPDGLYVPAQAHLQALREAIDPWVQQKDNDNERLPEVKKLLTVLPNASLEQIRKECTKNEYTHVHILAHGATFKNAGEERYGLALCKELDQTTDIVDGERLAIALTAHDASGTTRNRPTLVTLATCDSGNVNTVITPGGSIAHELNAAGIPWVIASQFPLWMKASAIAAKVLYNGLLKGKDPRWVLYELRQRLRTDSPGTHDWASIIAYSAVPWDFDKQVSRFRDQQTRRKMNVKFARIDELVGVDHKGEPSKPLDKLDANRITELESLCESIRCDLKKWHDELPITTENQKQKAERLGIGAASEKRIAIAYFLIKKDDESIKAYETARDLYRAALEADPTNNWAITQHLSLMTILKNLNGETDFAELRDDYGKLWIAAHEISQWQYRNSKPEERIYALGTLAELHLLSPIYADEMEQKHAKSEIRRCCKEMREIVAADTFPLFSTKRQFRRYLNYWRNPLWDDLAREALKSLGDKVPPTA